MPELIGADEIWEPASLDVMGNSAGGFVDRVRPEVAEVPEPCGRSFCGVSAPPVVIGKTWLVRTHELRRNATGAVIDQLTNGIVAERGIHLSRFVAPIP